MIPTTTLILGHIVDDVAGATNGLSRVAISVFAGGALGAIPAAFIYFVNTSYGWQPFAQFVIPSALTGYLTWVLIEPCLRFPPLRTAFVTLAVVVVFGSLSVGVLVMTGRF